VRLRIPVVERRFRKALNPPLVLNIGARGTCGYILDKSVFDPKRKDRLPGLTSWSGMIIRDTTVDISSTGLERL